MTNETVRVDSDLEQMERETILRMTADEDVVHVFSEQRAVVSAMLKHPAFDEHSRRQQDDAVVAVTGTIPINYLTVKGTGRKGDNNPSGAMPSVFEDGEPEVIDE